MSMCEQIKGYYPKQVPFLLDDMFKQHIQYCEYRFHEVEDICMCIWTMTSTDVLTIPVYNYILPDACLDLIIDFTTKTIQFAGFSKATMPFQMQGKVDYLGVRFKPGAFYALYHTAAEQVMDTSVVFEQIEKAYRLTDIFDVDQHERINQLKSYLIKKRKDQKDLRLLQLVDTLYKRPDLHQIAYLSERLGYERRQLYRVFKQHYGVSPKVLFNILRLHYCLTLMLEERMSLIQVANRCGFYDQSHFIHELKKYTGISPLQLLSQ